MFSTIYKQCWKVENNEKYLYFKENLNLKDVENDFIP